MPNRQFLMLWILIGLHLSCTPDPRFETGSAANMSVVFNDVNVVPMDSERVVERQTVVVHDGLISQVGPVDSVVLPPEAVEIDGRGRYLMPGLTDFHIHLRSPDELLSYLAYGVTTVVHMSGATSGAPDLLRYRDALADGEMVGPRLYTTGRVLDGDPPIFGGVSVVVKTPEEARRVVAEQKRTGYDFIKVYNNLTPDVLAAVTGAADEHGMAVVGHIPRVAGRKEALQRALAAGQDMIAHGEEYFFTYFYEGVDSLLDLRRIPYRDPSRIPAAVRMTREAGAYVTPNLSFVAMTRRQLDDLDEVLADSEAQYLSPEVLEMWNEQSPTRRSNLDRFDARDKAKYAFLKDLTSAMNEAGVPLLLGTDASAAGLFPGKSAHLELTELVAAGLMPYEALATGTRNAGDFLVEYGVSAAPTGRILEGYAADLILVRGNPLDDVGNAANIEGVMVNGRWFRAAELQAMRENRAANR